MSKNSVVIFGAGGHGKVVHDILKEAGVAVAGFIDEDTSKKGRNINGLKVLGGWSFLKANPSLGVALGIGNNKVREEIYLKIKGMGLKAVTAVHPKAVLSKSAKIGEGSVVMPGAVVNANASLEEGVVVNTGASVDHDCRLERFCQIWPGAHLAGTVKIGEFSYVGTGASVIQNITIGRDVMIGAGAAVVSDIPDSVTAVGVPARILRGDKRC